MSAWEFLERLISIALPRVRDFRGVSAKSSTVAVTMRRAFASKSSFRKLDYDKVDRPRS
ncbi:hypothetical protein OH492_03035 [Vibrio chagasii]|nr:hypothetical protein [Vibrio chagasii]